MIPEKKVEKPAPPPAEWQIRKAETDAKLRMCALANAVTIHTSENYKLPGGATTLQLAQEYLDWLRKPAK
jgi:hypothetical protein